MADFDVKPLNLEQLYSDYVDHSHPDTDPVTVDKLLVQMDSVYNETAKYRNRMLDKLVDTLDRVYIDPNVDDVDDISKKIMIFEQLNKTLAEKEKSFTTRINTRLKQKEADSNVMAGQMAVEMLKKISLSDNIITKHNEQVPDITQQLNQLDKAFTSDESVTTILDTELKSDPKDIPMLQLEEDSE